MNAADVVGYSFDGALYCVEHAAKRCNGSCTCGERDENGCCASNCHGYGPIAVFTGEADVGDSCDVPGCGFLAGCEPDANPEAQPWAAR